MIEPVLMIEPEAALVALAGSRIRGTETVKTLADWKRALVNHPRAVWVSTGGSRLAEWITTSGKPHSTQRLLLLDEPPASRWELLRAWFEFVVKKDGYALLPREDLFDVLTSEHREDRFIGISADKEAGAIVLLRGNLEPLVVPASWFRKPPDATGPSLDDCEITDWGNTIRLGEYEASADAVLYSFDRDYRKRAKARKVEQDSSFGGALRRLRLQKGLRRSDFPGITSKEIARIERGEVERPHVATLSILAERLGVSAEDIESY